ncbi:MAG: hypothetical protein JO115_06010 [Pseudonocardiales bacterium]|nr:hypothetical protein [Pseudonocardiales bacterium]
MIHADIQRLRAVPVGTGGSGTRVETDSMGSIDVPAEHYWEAQTQRSLIHFSIGEDHMPKAVYHAYGYIKKAAALINAEAGRLDATLALAITTAADEVIAGKLDAEFPLYVWQTGSGTQSNMNVNEVIANRASQLLGGTLGTKHPVHPNDHVNMGQSSNDSFPTAMHIATLLTIGGHTLPRLTDLADAIWAKAVEWVDVVKIGRTHLQDATPLTVGQEWSGWAVQLRDARDRLQRALSACHELAAGGTAVGTGLNAMRPIIINNVLHSAGILGDASDKLRRYSIEHTTLNRDTIEQYVQRSLMLITALSPYIGYDKASAIAHKADDEGTTLRDAALSMGVSAADFDRIVNPTTMVGHPRRDLGIE